jgi:hypothetical protein
MCLGDGDLLVGFDQVNLRKNGQPAMPSLRDCMLGRGYLSGTVTTLMQRQWLQGCQEPSFLGNRCRRDTQGEMEWRIISAFSSARNSSSETWCFSGASCQGRAKQELHFLCQCGVGRRGWAWGWRYWATTSLGIP